MPSDASDLPGTVITRSSVPQLGKWRPQGPGQRRALYRGSGVTGGGPADSGRVTKVRVSFPAPPACQLYVGGRPGARLNWESRKPQI